MISYESLMSLGKETGGALLIREGFFVSHTLAEPAEPMQVMAECFYEGSEPPMIRFELTAKGQSEPFYISHSYRMAQSGEYEQKNWRVPPILLSETTLTVRVEIPAETKLYIRNLDVKCCEVVRDKLDGVRHNAHLGFWGMAPDNTAPAFELAAKSGFAYCIAVPKVTKDGVLVCIHDDTINKTARDKNGNPPEEPIYVWDKTYEELCEWEYGSYKNEIYKGTSIPRLSEFFDICARSGMKPMFSTHPGLSVEQWGEVKEMLKSRGLLKYFHIKSFGIDILERAYSVFGSEIDGYTYDVGGWTPERVEQLKALGIDTKTSRVGIEIQFDSYTEEIAKTIKDAGFFASAWNVFRRDFREYERLISYGVTEFTEDYHCSMGLKF